MRLVVFVVMSGGVGPDDNVIDDVGSSTVRDAVSLYHIFVLN